MSDGFGAIDSTLNREISRWRWFRFLGWTFTLGAALSLLVMFLEAAILLGWLESRPLAAGLLYSLAGLGLVAWIGIAAAVGSGAAERSGLASALERADRRFLDRLNTFLFLECNPSGDSARNFQARIARQTERVLAEKVPASPISAKRPMLGLLVFGAALGGTLLLDHFSSPWSLLRDTVPAVTQSLPHSDAPPPPPVARQSLPPRAKAWGKVRITKPGRDLQVTKAAAVPLHIEAAASGRITNVSLFWAINGKADTVQELPAPSEPGYAAYSPNLHLDALHLSDWDIVSYYAKATTAQSNSYASRIYFLEITPSPRQMRNMPGGQHGKPYQSLNQLSALIHDQEQVIRRTYRYSQRSGVPGASTNQAPQQLSDAETDLHDSTRHLHAKIAGQMNQQPLGKTLDALDQAAASLAASSHLLRTNSLPDAQRREREALAQLSAARKSFQTAVGQNPSAFGNHQAQPDASHMANSPGEAQREAEEPPRATKSQTADQQLAQAYRLKQRLDHEARTFDQGAKTNSSVSQGALAETAQQARHTLQDLKRLAEQEPTRDAFGQPLRDSLDDSKMDGLNEQLDTLRRPQAPAKRRRRAKHAAMSLSAVSKAFEQSEPRSLQKAQLADAFQTAPRSGLKRGISELESLIRQLQTGGAVSSSGTAKQGHQALADIQSAVRDSPGPPGQKGEILKHLAELSRSRGQFTLAQLERLREQLRQYSVATARATGRHGLAEVTEIDPAQFPPAYRQRIEEYFQKLSEQ